jgi:cob(I)alamin adenosyltransferase
VLPDRFDQTELLIEIQNRLFTIGSNLASDPEKDLPIPDLNEDDILKLERAMDNMDTVLEPLRAFVLPGGSIANSIAHVCRTVTRRSERRMIALANVEDVNPILIKYTNRLSDYFFVMSRYVAHKMNHKEIPWIPRKS